MSKAKINRLDSLETVHVNSKKVSCSGVREGQKGVFGHPTVYLNMGDKDNVTCPYCGRNFKLKNR